MLSSSIILDITKTKSIWVYKGLHSSAEDMQVTQYWRDFLQYSSALNGGTVWCMMLVIQQSVSTLVPSLCCTTSPGQISPLNLGSIQNPQFGVNWGGQTGKLRFLESAIVSSAKVAPCIQIFHKAHCETSIELTSFLFIIFCAIIHLRNEGMRANFSEMCQRQLISKSWFWTKSNWKRQL